MNRYEQFLFTNPLLKKSLAYIIVPYYAVRCCDKVMDEACLLALSRKDLPAKMEITIPVWYGIQKRSYTLTRLDFKGGKYKRDFSSHKKGESWFDLIGKLFKS